MERNAVKRPHLNIQQLTAVKYITHCLSFRYDLTFGRLTAKKANIIIKNKK